MEAYCKTDRQREVIRALNDNNGNVQKTAKQLQIDVSCVHKTIKRVKALAARQGYSPDHDMTHTVPDGYKLKGTSTLYGTDGIPKLQWVKSDIDSERQLEIMTEIVESLTAEIPARPPIHNSRRTSTELANLYTITDYHIGQLSWAPEGGADWDISIARETLKSCFADMVKRSPRADTAIVNQLGDFLHYDGMTSVTPTSGFMLDADSRPEKMIQAGIECLDFLITEALKHHKRVILVCAQGNHDLYSALFLRQMFTRLYRDEPRLEIVQNAVPFYAFKFGRNMIGMHHGHKVKFDSLPALFANEYREMFGTTDRTYIHMGHMHHKEIKEVGKTIVEMHRTLAARDAHASYGGYHSQRATDVITYHLEKGEIGRVTVTP